MFVFLLLPKKVSVIFTSLSIMTVILNIQNREIKLEKINIEKLEKVLKISFSEEILLFPNYTVDWFWNKTFLEQEIVLENKKIKLYDAVACRELFNNNTKSILDIFINNLPYIIKYKLNINNIIERTYIEHNIMKTMLCV